MSDGEEDKGEDAQGEQKVKKKKDNSDSDDDSNDDDENSEEEGEDKDDEEDGSNNLAYKSQDINDDLMRKELFTLRDKVWEVSGKVHNQYDFGMVYLDC
jgi:hypothetical protein